MKINDMLEATPTPEDETNKIYEELLALLKDAGATIGVLDVSSKCAIKSKSAFIHTDIFGFVTPEMENGKYDADEAEIALRLAHRLISKWLAQKEASGQHINVNRYSNVGGGYKFSTQPYPIWTGSKYVVVPSIRVEVSIVSKEDTSTTN
jgi:hypothetical protein